MLSHSCSKLFLLSALISVTVVATMKDDTFNLKPFEIDLGSAVPRLRALVNSTRLPAAPLYPVGAKKGLQLDVLLDLRDEWLNNFDWETQQAELNEYSQFTADIEGQTVHFMHEKSEDPNAVPVILLHGWSGSFHEFVPVIQPLTQTWTNSSTGNNVSFNVVVPSLPGFVFSSPPPENWTVHDTARIFNTLMTEVLGYSTFAAHGTDWGSGVAYSLYSSFNQTVRAAHFNFLPFFPPSAEDIATNNITLSAGEEVTERRTTAWASIGKDYFSEQVNKPNDIGLALYDIPVGQLAWIGTKFKLWSDPRAGTPPSVLMNAAILTSVSLYYLTSSFLSSVWIYAQTPNGLNPVYSKAPTDAPMLFSQFEYNAGLWPQEYVERVGNLVAYNFYEFCGHFAGLDNPPALIESIRRIGAYF